MLLRGKVAVVTGSSRGIGKAIALELAGQGADIVLNYAGNIQAAQDTAAAISGMGRDVLPIKADISDSSQVNEMFKSVLSHFGKIDILVNNAGVTRDNLIMRMKESDWDEVLDINLKGAFNCIKAVSKSMLKAHYGRIINITSVIGLTGNISQANYAASKAGLIGLTKSVARELGSRSITVNAVAPGFVGTEMTEILSDEVKKSILSKIPLGRVANARDIAMVVAFLAGEAAGYITGQVVAVDGGMTMC